MFDVAELSECVTQNWFVRGYAHLERNLLLTRLGLQREIIASDLKKNLKRFSQAVIASAPTWENPREGEGRQLCQLAGDIEVGLSVSGVESSVSAHVALFKAILLYDLAGLPGASASFAARNGFDPRLREFFMRDQNSLWGKISPRREYIQERLIAEPPITDSTSYRQLFEQAIGDVIQEAGLRLQENATEERPATYLNLLSGIASHYALSLTGDDLRALERLIELRMRGSSLQVVPRISSLDEQELRAIGAPIELWPAQVRALERGLLDKTIQSFGFAAPTGTGKTALTKLVIADAIAANPNQKILYLCPSKALVQQVGDDLRDALGALGLRVLNAGAHLVVHELIPISSDDADVLVFTPERADLLLRIDPEYLQRVCLVVVDEAHHIEQGSRGVLLEFYLWRLRKMLPMSARIVQLSAVAPNISDLTNWVALRGRAQSVMVDWRTTRLRVGLLERSVRGGAILSFGESPPYHLLPDGTLPNNPKRGLAILANHLSQSGIVLVLCTSPRKAEDIAGLIAELRTDEQNVEDDISQRLDAWIERELYPESELRAYYRRRVVFHHAQMPPRVRVGIEDAIRGRKVDVICATTTLAEGVNFPFSTVVVEALVSKALELSPRALWNIAGRAGRFGVDTEGHCILFRPSLWADDLTEYELSDYTKVKLADIPPVRSALAYGIERLDALLNEGKIDSTSLEAVSLSEIKIDNRATDEAKAVRALINLMRVGYAHANSTGVISLQDRTAPEFEGELLAATQMPAETKHFARRLGTQQRDVIGRATAGNPEFVEIAARVGWSLEAQHALYEWLRTRQNWQLEQFGNTVVAGYVRNLDHLGYLIGPLAKHLIAFEGAALGGAISFLGSKWIQGIPLASFQEERGASFGRMVSNIYGRMQYLLPWGLYGMHELLQYEAKLRSISVSDGVSALSILAAEGVPNFDALQLVLHFGIERVDATRLSQRYQQLRLHADIRSWFINSTWSEIERCVRKGDQRRIDPSLLALHRRLKEEQRLQPQ